VQRIADLVAQDSTGGFGRTPVTQDDTSDSLLLVQSGLLWWVSIGISGGFELEWVAILVWNTQRIARGAKYGAAGMGFEPIPWRASEARRRQRWKPKGRDAIGGSMRSTTARPGIAGGRTDAVNAGTKNSDSQNRPHASP